MAFVDILGHDRLLETFRRALRLGRLAHAYIFEGPAGSGKGTTALALVQALFCQQRVDDDACGVCPSCRKVVAGSHGDIHRLAPDGQFIKIDQVRELQRELMLRPYEACRKVCIIEQADAFNPSSGNALLKTLEEPPGDALIILLTENGSMLLPTIRSRCQTMVFQPLSPEIVRTLLERQGVEPALAAAMAPMAGGSMERALKLDNEAVQSLQKTVLARLSGFSLDRIASVFDTSEECAGSRDDAQEAVDLLISLLRDALHLSLGESQILNSLVQDDLLDLARKRGVLSLLDMLEASLETKRGLLRNANSKLALDHLGIVLAGA